VFSRLKVSKTALLSRDSWRGIAAFVVSAINQAADLLEGEYGLLWLLLLLTLFLLVR